MKKASKKRKKVVSQNNTTTTYGQEFLQATKIKKRGDKSIYIRQEYHEGLSRIVQMIGKDEIPLYAYLDNILEHHFVLFEKPITKDFNQKFKPLF